AGEIFTEVEGVMTADPRLVPQARPVRVMTYNDLCEMAHQGAKVIHPRAVEIAGAGRVPLRIRSTFSGGEGTYVTDRPKSAAPGESAMTGDRTVSELVQTGGRGTIVLTAVENLQQTA